MAEPVFPISGVNPDTTRTEMTWIVMPGQANALGTVFGGQIMAWVDVCAAVSAQRLSRSNVVTVGMDELTFQAPIRQGHESWIERTGQPGFHALDCDGRGSGPGPAFVAGEAHGNPIEIAIVVGRKGLVGGEQAAILQAGRGGHPRPLKGAQALWFTVCADANDEHVVVPGTGLASIGGWSWRRSQRSRPRRGASRDSRRRWREHGARCARQKHREQA